MRLARRTDDADVRENQDWVWLNSSIDMIQVQGFQYDPVYYQLLEPLSTGVQQRFSHTFGKYILSCSGDTVETPGNCRVLQCPWLSPSRWTFLPLNNTQLWLTSLRSQVSLWKMNVRLHWKLLAEIIIHLHQHYHHLNISSTPPHHNAGHSSGPIREQLGVRWGEMDQWGLSLAVMMSDWCGILKCSSSQQLPYGREQAQLF